MHGHHEDITSVNFTLTAPSQIDFVGKGPPFRRGEGGGAAWGGPLWSPALSVLTKNLFLKVHQGSTHLPPMHSKFV
jgi:hypothetical protein